MKKISAILLLTICIFLCACQIQVPSKEDVATTTNIFLSDQEITADGVEVGRDQDQSLYVANDIIYYEAGKDFTYGEGTEKDAHEKEEADAHTVLHITKAGTYILKGKLSQGQIAIDLGKDAKNDKRAVVTLILDGLDVTCTVAPAVIFYNVYECGSTDTKNATKDVNTEKAGANVILADDSVNTINGSYVERIYKADTVVLNKDETKVEDAKKLHKYDGAFYSKMSMNVGSEEKGNGILNITAENEGLDTELHLTINGGEINIRSGNDGINTNEDNVSVTTINGGKLNIKVTGETGEGDGIDSNGWLIINGGNITCQACSTSADAGIDSDNGIHINGGTVIAGGSMLDRIEDGGQTYALFNFAQKQNGGEKIKLKNEKGYIAFEARPENAYSVLIISTPDLAEGTYTLWSDSVQLQGQSGGSMMGGPEIPPADGNNNRPNEEMPPQRPDGQNPGQERIPSDKIEKPENDSQNPGFNFPGNGQMPDFNFPEGFPNFEFPEGQMPEGLPNGQMPGGQMPNGQMPNGQMPNGQMPEGGFGQMPEEKQSAVEYSTEFVIQEGGNLFSGIKAVGEETKS